MRLRHLKFVLRMAMGILLIPMIASAESSALILNGVAGDQEHADKFNKWTEATRKVLVDQFGFLANRVMVLSDTKTTKADIQGAFTQLKQQLKAGDTFFLFFIGHGSGAEGDYKFNISGPDFTATEYNAMLSSLNTGRIVVINSTPASGASIEALAGKNRVIVTATRSGGEGNDTVFYEYFLKGLQDAAGSDTDKDHKTSVWEAFKYANDGIERFYKDEGRIVTEHALLSDNGPSKTPATATDAPVVARMTTFQVDRPITVADSRLQGLLNEQKDLLQKIDALKINKASLAAADYDKQLEDLQIQLALKDQQIREMQKK